MADLGLTCGGNLERAVQLIEAAAHLGTDAVKFQMLDAEALLGDKSVTYTYPTLTLGIDGKYARDVHSSSVF